MAEGRKAKLVCLIAAAAACAGSLLALDPKVPLDEYGLEIWTNDSGLPQNTVSAVLQTADGYVWAGTSEGLARFDGARFTVFDSRNTPALRSNAVVALAEGPDKTLWIGTASGLVRRRSDEFLAYPESHPLGDVPVSALSFSRDGSLWVSLGVRIGRLRGNELRVLPHRLKTPVFTVHESRDGRLWVGTGMGLQLLQPDGTWLGHPIAAVPEYAPIRQVTESPDGSLWIAHREGLVRKRGETVESFSSEHGLTEFGARAVYGDPSGTVWVGSQGRGLCRIEGRRVECLTSAEGLSDEQVMAITGDIEGNVWAGTYLGGLARLRDQSVTNFGSSRGLSQEKIATLFEDRDGNLWAAGFGGTLDRMRPGSNRFEPVARVDNRINAMTQDSRGTIWIGTNARGLGFLSGNRIEFLRYESKIPPAINALEADPDGGLWVGTFGGGLQLLRDGRRVRSWGRAEGLPGPIVSHISRDAEGRMWVSCFGGVAIIGPEGVRTIRAPGPVNQKRGGNQALPSRPGTLLPGPTVYGTSHGANGSVWITTSEGLGRLRGTEMAVFRESSGLPHNVLQFALEDGRGFLWLMSNFGIYRVSIADLEAQASGRISRARFDVFGRADGMGNAECNHGDSGAARTRDGHLWFATMRGVSRVDPARLSRNTVPPPLTLEEIRANGERLRPGAPIALGPGRHDLEFRYTAASFRKPDKVSFRYRLEGFDRDWVNAGNRRVAYYTNLPPGRYRFQVVAANEDGVWNTRGPSTSLSLAPRLHQTPWFWAALAGLVIAAGIAGHRVRLRRLQAREQMKTALVEAQLRALQAQLRPHFLFNALNSVLPLIGSDTEQARRMVLRIAELLRLSLSMEPGRLIPLEEELEVLDRYLEIERARFGPRLEVGFHIDPGMERALVPMFLLQPLVENAIKHGMENRGGQGRIEVWASEEEKGRLAIAVRDNGPGLSANAAQSPWRGIGLRNTKERLERLYPEHHALALSNTAGGGCEVRVTIPLQTFEPGPESEQEAPDADTHAHSG